MVMGSSGQPPTKNGRTWGLPLEAIDWFPHDQESSIGTILYHIADIEAGWLFVEVLEQSLPPKVSALFPHPARDAEGRLTQVLGFSLAVHLERLATVRWLLLNDYRRMDLTEFRRVRSLPDYDVTPEWVLHQLMQCEAEYRSQIGQLQNRAEWHLAQR